MQLPVTKIQKFCTHDGPGVRTTVFLKGCPLRCRWCHNPETQSIRQEFFYTPSYCLGCRACVAVCTEGVHAFTAEHIINRSLCKSCNACTKACPSGALEACAQQMSAKQIMSDVMKDRAFYGEKGGLTLSGGEPLLHGKNILPLLQTAKENGLTTVIETCGVFEPTLLDTIVPMTDLFLWDIKDTNPERHRTNTGGSLETVLANLRKADSLCAKTRLRCILLQGVNLNDEHLAALTAIYHSLRYCEGIELLPYHTYGDSKNMQLALPSAAHLEWIPTSEQMEQAKRFVAHYAVLIQQ